MNPSLEVVVQNRTTLAASTFVLSDKGNRGSGTPAQRAVNLVGFLRAVGGPMIRIKIRLHKED